MLPPNERHYCVMPKTVCYYIVSYKNPFISTGIIASGNKILQVCHHKEKLHFLSAAVENELAAPIDSLQWTFNSLMFSILKFSLIF